MPLPRALAEFNRHVTNRITRRFAGRLPGFAVVVHRGRATGRVYKTPVNAFRRHDGSYVIALTYGPRSQWVRNVLAAGGGLLVTGGRRIELTNPRIVGPAEAAVLPAPARLILRLLNVDQFLELAAASRRSVTPPAAS